MKVPKINKVYNYFDDGKIRESRKESALITEIVPFDKIDNETLKLWEEEVGECYWLYSEETDFFIKATLQNTEDVIFVRTIRNGWFSLGFWGGVLDVDGSLTNRLYEQL